MAGDEKPPRKCGDNCPEDNVSPTTTTNCRICKKSCHLPCHNVSYSVARLFIIDNIVFICDTCLLDLDNEKSPKRKGINANSSVLRQYVLSPGMAGNMSLSQQQQQQQQQKPFANSAKSTRNPSNETLYDCMKSMMKKIEKIEGQTQKIDDVRAQLGEVGNDVIVTKNQTEKAYNVVFSRLMLREQQNMRDLAKEMFDEVENRTDTFTTPNGTVQQRIYPNPRPQSFANVLRKESSGTPKRKPYSTVLQKKLPVKQRDESDTPQQRKRETHISLVDNASATTVTSMKIPTPKQGKKATQIGRPLEIGQSAPRKLNPMSKSIWISKFHPETMPEEIEKYIVEQTEVKDKTKFKCVKLVKKDQDVTTLKFVSFKIDATPAVYDILINEENWPQDKQVREFLRMSPPKTNLGDFIQQQPATSNDGTSNVHTENENETAAMEIADGVNNGASGSGTGESNSNSSNNKSPPKNE